MVKVVYFNQATDVSLMNSNNRRIKSNFLDINLLILVNEMLNYYFCPVLLEKI
jgi:hypothetical protein